LQKDTDKKSVYFKQRIARFRTVCEFDKPFPGFLNDKKSTSTSAMSKDGSETSPAIKLDEEDYMECLTINSLECACIHRHVGMIKYLIEELNLKKKSDFCPGYENLKLEE